MMDQNKHRIIFIRYDNWFLHRSPDNKETAYISYIKDQQGQHLFGKDIVVRLLNTESLKTGNLTDAFYGGQGTFNVHSWSP